MRAWRRFEYVVERTSSKRGSYCDLTATEMSACWLTRETVATGTLNMRPRLTDKLTRIACPCYAACALEATADVEAIEMWLRGCQRCTVYTGASLYEALVCR